LIQKNNERENKMTTFKYGISFNCCTYDCEFDVIGGGDEITNLAYASNRKQALIDLMTKDGYKYSEVNSIDAQLIGVWTNLDAVLCGFFYEGEFNSDDMMIVSVLLTDVDIPEIIE
jgi:hypothetical protein